MRTRASDDVLSAAQAAILGDCDAVPLTGTGKAEGYAVGRR